MNLYEDKSYSKPSRVNTPLLTALPVSLASIFVVLVIPNCQQTPRQITVEAIDSNIANDLNAPKQQQGEI